MLVLQWIKWELPEMTIRFVWMIKLDHIFIFIGLETMEQMMKIGYYYIIKLFIRKSRKILMEKIKS